MSPLQMQDEVLWPLLGTSHQDLCWVSVQAFLGTLTGQALPLRARPGVSQQCGRGSPQRSPRPLGAGLVAKDGPSSGSWRPPLEGPGMAGSRPRPLGSGRDSRGLASRLPQGEPRQRPVPRGRRAHPRLCPLCVSHAPLGHSDRTASLAGPHTAWPSREGPVPLATVTKRRVDLRRLGGVAFAFKRDLGLYTLRPRTDGLSSSPVRGPPSVAHRSATMPRPVS